MYKNLPKLTANIEQKINDLYNDYVPRVSAKGHAGSLELGLYCYRIALAKQPNTIVDLGSGFTSAVLRLYQKNKNCNVISVDDNADWLEKTKKFLDKHYLESDNLVLWDTFLKTANTYDFVLYDLGRLTTRIQFINEPFKLINETGVLILDDAHFDATYSAKYNIKPPFLGDVITDAIERHGLPADSLYDETVDGFGRYAKIVWRTA